jgi:transcriptional regulator with XRE-family HTH domain
VTDRGGKADPRLRRFGARLRELREQQGLTIEALADQAGVGARQIARVEAGRASPSLLWLLDVATGLGLEPAELLPDRTAGR